MRALIIEKRVQNLNGLTTCSSYTAEAEKSFENYRGFMLIKTLNSIPDIAGTGSQPAQVLDPFLNNQGAHGHSWGRFGFR